MLGYVSHLDGPDSGLATWRSRVCFQSSKLRSTIKYTGHVVLILSLVLAKTQPKLTPYSSPRLAPQHPATLGRAANFIVTCWTIRRIVVMLLNPPPI